MTSLEPLVPAGPADSGLGPRWAEDGLSVAQLEQRRARAPTRPVGATSQSFWSILRRNAFTRLNLLLVALGAATLATGSAPDATFLAIAVINTVVGTTEEARAKRALDRLAVINAPHARVVRGGATTQVPPDDLVVDDLLDLRPGDQVTADAVVCAGRCEVDESLATGESDTVAKAAGGELISGSWIIAGAVRARVTRAGADSYANRIAEEARRFSLVNSELVHSVNQVLRILSWAMVVIAPLLIVRQLQVQPWREAVRGAVAGLVGMIPEGLVLLTTMAFLAAAVRLGRRRVLVQELPAVETLARVDVLCVDKTGTLTEGRVVFGDLVAGDADRDAVVNALAAFAAAPDANATLRAVGDALKPSAAWRPDAGVPFSSARKWSALGFEGHGSWVIGAPEMVGGADPAGLLVRAADAARQGRRVLVVARSEAPLRGEALPAGLEVTGIVELVEKARSAVSATLRYFADQGVGVRVISGDNPATVRVLAEQVGLPGAEAALDARALPTDPDALGAAIETGRIFGRVTPHDKQSLVGALRRRGHVVAMTGDGVNDVLALKEADLGIAMGSGSAITRGVAQLVNLDDDFDVLPAIVGEGRRVLANIEKVAALFLVKNVYSMILAVTTAVVGWPYPFLPRHLTLISAVGIGIPGVVLALGPSERRFAPGFLWRVLTFSVIAGVLTAAAVMVTYALARAEGSSGDSARTAAIIVTVMVTLWVLSIAARPLTGWHLLLVGAMAGLFAAAFFTPWVSTFFSLQHRPSPTVLVEALAVGAVAAAAIDLVTHLEPVQRLSDRRSGTPLPRG
ncbi:MAG TPA: HAD-IC family P-type ATPase [Acidimicrobiales bacterium]|nr:HAD-IC family P-type ATPase [Acidimicrobiales bacterium]